MDLNRLKGVCKEHKAAEWQLIILLYVAYSILLYMRIDFTRALETYRDELIYFNIAKCIANNIPFSVQGISINFTNIAYPLFMTPLFFVKNTIRRMHMITLVNALLMGSAIVWIWLICRELEVNRRYTWISVFLMALYPDMLMAATFMAENLYWPLMLVAFYLFIRTYKTKKLRYAFWLGVFSYLCYWCKEVGVCFWIAVNVFFILEPVETYIFETEPKEKKIIKFYMSQIRWKCLLVCLCTFIVLKVGIENILLAGIQSSYGSISTVAGSVFSIDRQAILFLVKAFLYNLAIVGIGFLVIPMLYPLIHYSACGRNARKCYFFWAILLLGMIMTIICTVTLREDMGTDVIRVHMRYLGPLYGMLVPIFMTFFQQKQKKHKIWKECCVWGAYIALVFISANGMRIGSTPEALSTAHIVVLYNKLVSSCLQWQVNPSFIFRIILSASACILIVCLCLYEWTKFKRFSVLFMCFLVLIFSMFSWRYAWKIVRDSYSVPRGWIDDMLRINNYLRTKVEDEANVVFLTQGCYSKYSKVYDTYLDRKYAYMTPYTSFFGKVDGFDDETIQMSDMVLYNDLMQADYSVSDIDYYIMDNEMEKIGDKLISLKMIEELSQGAYSVYYNEKPTLLVKHHDDRIRYNFTKSGYNLEPGDIMGLSSAEDEFSWTDGHKVIFQKIIDTDAQKALITIKLHTTYYGEQTYIVKHGNDIIVQDCAYGPGEISFEVPLDNGMCSFEMELPDAISPVETGESKDARTLALAFKSIYIDLSDGGEAE